MNEQFKGDMISHVLLRRHGIFTKGLSKVSYTYCQWVVILQKKKERG